MNPKPLDPSKINITSRTLHQPPLDELMNVLAGGLTANFEEATIDLADCPNFSRRPYNFFREGLCGNPIIFEIGSPAYLLPTVQRDKIYDIKTLLQHINYNHDTLVIGAGAGPWPRTGCNCELIMKLNLKLNSNDSEPGLHDNFQVQNGTHYAFVDENNEGRCRLQRLADNDTESTFALLGNLYACEGKPGKVIKVRAKKRTGKLDFISCMQKALEKHYENKLVGLGGMFEMKNGKVKQHIMPDFSDTPLTSEIHLNNWLRFYDMPTPLIAVGTFVSAETDLDLRVQHFHSAFEKDNELGLGGHYHIDTTPDTIEYEGYFNVAATLYRVDQPPNKLQFGKD
ncbi:ester hydrolase C11orf54 homolog [Monomorium pharaonis]|uniref:ester hydrolase C11orf54 homolog n=1 Tax=Monomorium pharaonis TaxID=307658 RepID=UPI00063EE8F8|nr:ester hydrolase C11orf54 homolog [Monomorium pharaonis]XP_028048091.1 ester hydrolase C11orf54 homolog [Monomorium pharaonis]